MTLTRGTPCIKCCYIICLHLSFMSLFWPVCAFERVKINSVSTITSRMMIKVTRKELQFFIIWGMVFLTLTKFQLFQKWRKVKKMWKKCQSNLTQFAPKLSALSMQHHICHILWRYHNMLNTLYWSWFSGFLKRSSRASNDYSTDRTIAVSVLR